ncbi:AMP-binding protein [Spirosoma aerophilum]
MIWTSGIIQRIILDTAGRLVQKPHMGLPTTVSPELDLDHDLGIDSLQRMELAAHLNEFFGILHTSPTNYLLADTHLHHWTNCILRARLENDHSITFRTSGTNGQARPITHSLASLLAEAHFLAQLLPKSRQVVSMVPANHIYGFLFTILLPTIWERPLRLMADLSVADLDADTLLIGTPFTWELLAQSLPTGTYTPCRGVSSAAPMPPALFAQLVSSGISLTEIYGSSDTGGLAYRHSPNAPFTLFSYLTLHAGDAQSDTRTSETRMSETRMSDTRTSDTRMSDTRTSDTRTSETRTSATRMSVTRLDTGNSYLVPDRLEQVSPREFRVLGRVDEAVSIAGVNVYPAYIKKIIDSCPLVADSDIYAKADAGVSQLYGAIRLRTLNDPNREACLRWLREHLTAPEIPKHLYVY